MKQLTFLIGLLSLSVFAQDSISTFSKSKFPIDVETIIGVDNFGTKYYETNNVFYKKTAEKTINYSNVQLGRLTSVDVFNPLKLIAFYKDFNTVIILDNRLAEILRIDFNTVQPYKNASFVSLGNDNTIWIFNQDNQQLEVYDYKAKSVRATTIPVVSNALSFTSNYNYAWLLTENYIYKYSYFGSLIFKIKNTGYTKLTERNDDIILQKGNNLFFLNDKTQEIIPIALPNLLINQFLVTGETVYIYDSKILHEFQLKN
ncbi:MULTISPECIES: hypothetical protein [Bizionia]|uniref:Uncharacterized protein n=1 Tax=Bizionia algoritergicola TaxID=291187 RepID=A0A5D0R3Z4_9FLAO|nr:MULTISPECIES: hypothetical protein [Bizionia]OBX23890.1 hypothetical protein BAA08_02730 [Bizionia sp. APA-3]TYB75581.1 hypothetical protein ES675_05525 [Bizionia algoritergicola]